MRAFPAVLAENAAVVPWNLSGYKKGLQSGAGFDMRCRYCQNEFPVNDEQMAGGEVRCPQCGVSLGRGNQKVVFACPECSKPLEGELLLVQ